MHAWKEVITPLLVNTTAHKHVILGDADSRRTACFCSLRQPQLPSGDGKKQNTCRQKTVERFYKEKLALFYKENVKQERGWPSFLIASMILLLLCSTFSWSMQNQSKQIICQPIRSLQTLKHFELTNKLICIKTLFNLTNKLFLNGE